MERARKTQEGQQLVWADISFKRYLQLNVFIIVHSQGKPGLCFELWWPASDKIIEVPQFIGPYNQNWC